MQINYGENKSIDISVPQNCLVVNAPATEGVETKQLLRQALNAPLGLPGIKQCLTPDDTVTIALGGNIPHEGEVVAAVLEKLEEAGVQPENITLLSYGGKYRENAKESVSESDAAESEFNGKIKRYVHYTDQPQAYTIVSTTESGEPLAFVRPMVESDIIIPIGVADALTNHSSGTSRFGVFSSIYPRYAMKDALSRFEHPALFGLNRINSEDALPEDVQNNISHYRPTALDEYMDLEDMSRRRWEKVAGIADPRAKKIYSNARTDSEDPFEGKTSAEIRELLYNETQAAGWELGVVMLMEVVPGAGNSLAKVFFGLPAEVEKDVNNFIQTHNKALDKAAISGIGKLKFNRKPAKILCAFNAPRNCQSWANAVETLEAAAEKGTDGCPLFFCGDVSEPLGKGFQFLSEADSFLAGNKAAISAALFNENFEDSLAALRWIRLVEFHKIFWMSNLSDEIIESLGGTPVKNGEEMERILNSY